MKTVLITGISGGMGRLVAKYLLARKTGYRVVGVDREPWKNKPPAVTFHLADVRKTKLDDVIRTEKPDAIIHLAFVRHFRANAATRHEINVNGTRRLMDLAVHHHVKKLVIFSSNYVYGALPENPYYMNEDFPLSASRTYPNIRDLAELDMLAGAFLWQHPEVAVSVLRPVNVIGRQVRSTMGRYLARDYVPTVLGFNPMLQFLHEEDMAEAILLTVEKNLRGIFNVTGPGAVPLDVAIRETGGTAIPLPEMLIRPLITTLFQWGLYPFPPGAMDFLKYQCTLDGQRFRHATGFTPRFELKETFGALGR